MPPFLFHLMSSFLQKVSNQGTVRIADFGAFDSMTAKARDYKPPGLAGGSVHKPETQRYAIPSHLFHSWTVRTFHTTFHHHAYSVLSLITLLLFLLLADLVSRLMIASKRVSTAPKSRNAHFCMGQRS